MAAISRQFHLKSSPNFLLLSKSSKILNPISQISITNTRRAKIPTKHFNCITQVKASSKPVVISLVWPHRNAAFRCYDRYIFQSNSDPHSQFKEDSEGQDLDEIRNELVDTFSAGIKLCSEGSRLPVGQRLLCFQVSGDVHPGQFREQIIRKNGQVVNASWLKCPTYKFDDTQAAAGLLYNFRESWFHGCSILLDELRDLHKKVHFSDFQGQGKIKRNQSDNLHSEVTLFALADKKCDINHKFISGRDQLRTFLRQLPQTNLKKVHMTCLTVQLDIKDHRQEYFHVSL